jgi:hypothetical protein
VQAGQLANSEHQQRLEAERNFGFVKNHSYNLRFALQRFVQRYTPDRVLTPDEIQALCDLPVDSETTHKFTSKDKIQLRFCRACCCGKESVAVSALAVHLSSNDSVPDLLVPVQRDRSGEADFAVCPFCLVANVTGV